MFINCKNIQVSKKEMTIQVNANHSSILDLTSQTNPLNVYWYTALAHECRYPIQISHATADKNKQRNHETANVSQIQNDF